MKEKIKGIYLVLTSDCCRGRDPLAVARESASSGIDIIQMREKNISPDKIVGYGTHLKNICRENNVLFIVNDDPYLAKKLDADGVHLGQEDMMNIPLDKVREIVGEKVVGVSTHSIEQFEKANNEDVDYIAFGPVFYTKTKDYYIGIKDVENVLSAAKRPVFFIGGINTSNIKELTALGVKNIAMIRAITEADNINETIVSFKNCLRG